MVGEERPPGLRRQGAPPLRHEPRDGALGDVDPQPEKFPVNSRGAPQRIGRSHPCHESLELSIDGWAASDGPSGELGPVLAEAAPLPPQNGVGGHDDESLPPAGPTPSTARPRRGGRSYAPSAESPSSCRRRAGGARPGSPGRHGGERRRGGEAVEAGGAGG